jgi:8-oxo-dGTP pyrophosphatase MutT (NUDIX family)
MRLAHGAAMLAARFSRPMLLGVRGIVADDANRIFLVRHSYVEGWHFPGGGVERGETLVDALARELEEEGNIVLDGPPILHGVFFNRKLANRDHVGVYLVRQFHQTGPRAPDREIAESGFFPLDELPAGIAPSARSRIAEVFEDGPISPLW